ncbi:hypothetical protein [Ornithinimicrobium tianjinense]|uniref:Uncharacterized protein n=1 Tax=Ornithinimicrobium tianjinense TaxID=1195761 RepID=A0A917BC23_9MICO|nr:hypothetical protein [Ornithinimicrobium tianjinense]GGF36755.1 hypothetical protein GCM10011366_00480 [Ornithinimicrobium tianjinense]
MNAYLDTLVAQSIAHEREHQLQQALRHREIRDARRLRGRHLAVAHQHGLRARVASMLALSH